MRTRKHSKNNTTATRPYSRTMQALALAGLLMAGGAGLAPVAQAAPLPGSTWGDITTTDAAQTTTSTIGVWRNAANNGNLTIAKNTALTVDDTSGTHTANLLVGQGNLLLQGSLSLNNGGKLVVGKDFTLADGASLTMEHVSGSIRVGGDMTALGKVTTTPFNGTTIDIGGSLNWGDNNISLLENMALNVGGNMTAGDIYAGPPPSASSTAGTTILVGGNLTAKNLTLEGGSSEVGNLTAHSVHLSGNSASSQVSLTVKGDLVATGDASTISGKATMTLKNATFADVTFTNASTNPIDAFETTVSGSFHAATVTLNNAIAKHSLTLGSNSASTSHSAKRVDITKGTLGLLGSDSAPVLLTTTEGVHFTGASADDAVLQVQSGMAQIKGGIHATGGNKGTIDMTKPLGEDATLHADSLTVDGAGSEVHLKGADITASPARFDTLHLTNSGALFLDGEIALQLSAAQANGITDGKVVIKTNTIAAVGGDWTYEPSNSGKGLTFASSNLPDGSTGAIAVDGQLTLKGTNGITLNNQTNTGAAANTVNGSLWAETLRTEGAGTNEVTLEGKFDRTKSHSQLQLVGNGGDMFTSSAGATSINISATGSLGLGSSSLSDNFIGAGQGAKPSGTLEQVDFTNAGGTGRVVFYRGDTTVKNLVNAASSGHIMLADAITTGSKVLNKLTLGTGAAASQAFAIKNLTLSSGNFTVNNGSGFSVNEDATVDLTSGSSGGSLDKLTLNGDRANLTTDTGASNGTLGYGIGELKLTDAANKVSISKYHVTTDTLNLNGTAVTSGNLKVGSTANAKGIWQINNIVKGSGGSADFTLENDGVLLLGKDITLGNSAALGGTAFTLDGEAYTVLGNSATSTIGSTGTLTLTTDANGDFTVGNGTAAAGAVQQGILGMVIKANAANSTLNIIGGATATALGDGTKFFENIRAINVADGNKGGSLTLGGMDADGTAAAGGTYDGTITLGTNANTGTLAVAGGNVNLSKVVMDSASKATVNLSGTGTLNIKTSADGGITYTDGITLSGANHKVDIGANTNYTVAGGINVTAGTVDMKSATLGGGVVLQGTAAGDAKFTLTGSNNTLDSLTIAEGKAGTVTLTGAALTVGSDLDLHRAALNVKATAGSTNTLTSTGTLTTGALSATDSVSGGAASAGETLLSGYGPGRKFTLKAQSWAVKDSNGDDAAVNIALTRNPGSSNNLTLILELGTGTGNAVTAKSFSVGQGATVQLRGAGGHIKLTGADGTLQVGNGGDALGVLEVGKAHEPSHWSTDKLSVNKQGKLNVAEGSMTVGSLSMSDPANNGSITLGKRSEKQLGVLRARDVTLGTGKLQVEYGYAQFGSTSAALDTAISNALTSQQANAALAVTGKQLVLGGSTVTIGASLLSQDKRDVAQTFFAPDSLAFFDLGTVGQTDYAITSTKDVYMEGGAQIAVHKEGGLKVGDGLRILETTNGGLIKGLWAVSDRSAGSRLLGLSLTLNDDHTKLDGLVTMGNLAQTMPGLAHSLATYLGRMTSTLGVDPDSHNAGVRFVSRAASYSYMPNDKQAATTIEGAAQTAVTGATPGMTLAASSAAVNAVTARTSFASPLMDKTKAVAVHMDENGVSLDQGLNAGEGLKNGVGLWIMPLYQSENVWGMKSGEFKTGYNGDLAGVALGADYTFADAFRVGLALNVGGGYAQSSGDFNQTDNNFNFWGVSLYGGWTQDNFGLTADVGYTSSYNKLTQEVPASMQMGGDLKSDVTSYAITAGLRGEYKIETSVMDILPHVGVRYTSLNVNEYDVKRSGTVFSVDQTNQSIWTFPVGVTFSKDIDMKGGWIFKPQVDLSVIPAAGDVKTKSKAHIPGVAGNAELETQVVDTMTYQGGLGFDIKNDNMAFGINYNIQASEHRTAHGVFGTFRYEF